MQYEKVFYRFGRFLLAFVGLVLLLAAILPYKKNGYMREQEVKMAMLSAPDRKPAVVLLGGSNVAFGYDSGMLSDSLGMPVVNAGLHASVGLKYIIDDCFPRLRRGDILVLSPEYGHFFGNMAYGEAPMTDLVYLSDFRLVHKLNWRQLYSLLNNTPKYLRIKLEYTFLNTLPMAKDSVYSLSAFNEYGDVVAHWKHDECRYSETLNPQPLGIWNSDFVFYLKNELCALRKKGIYIIMCPPVVASTYYLNNRLNIEYADSVLYSEGLPFVVPPLEAVYPDTLFYDTGYHLRRMGAKKHTESLIRLLRR